MRNCAVLVGKNFFILLLAMLFILTNTACYDSGTDDNQINSQEITSTIPEEANNSYTVNVFGNDYYMTFDDYSVPEAKIQSLEFDSIDEIKRKIKECDFEDWQYSVIKSAFPRDEKGTPIFNLEETYEPITPTEISVQCVYWIGESFSFYLKEQVGVFGYLHYYDLDSFIDVFDSEYEEYFNKSTIHITEREEIVDRNAVVTYFYTTQGQFKHIRYTLNNADLVYYVDELYRISMNDSTILTSDTIPSSISVYASSEDKNFVLYLYDLEIRPSIEWILSFGLT